MCGALLRHGKQHGRAAIVDHLEPLELSPGLELDPDNLRAVCRTCHGVCASIEARYSTAAEVKAAKLKYRPVGLDGYPIRLEKDL